MAGRMRIAIPLAALLATGGCSGTPEPDVYVPPEPVPFPSMAFSGQGVALFPVTLMVAEEELGWGDMLRPREEGLHTADSIIATFLTERVPEVEWILPEELRRAAARAPGMLPDPDHMGTAVLRAQGMDRVPDPLISELRNLTAVAGNRWAAVPASLVFLQVHDDETGEETEGVGRAELTVVMVDVRRNQVPFRSVASGEGEDPWTALWNALKTLVPDLP